MPSLAITDQDPGINPTIETLPETTETLEIETKVPEIPVPAEIKSIDREVIMRTEDPVERAEEEEVQKKEETAIVNTEQD